MPALSFLDRAHSVAPTGYSRWLIPPAALAIHLCIGQAYATSVYKDALVKHFDTSLTAIGVVFSVAIVMLGVSAALFGTWVDRVGPRRTMFTSACCWSAGFLIAAAGIATEQLWLVYLGYGVVGGIGLGLGYISPVSTLIKWFPDRPGLATGMAIMGFGGGAMVAAPLSKQLLSFYGGTAAGGTAVMKLFVTLGVAYFVVMMLGVFTVRVPAPGWHPAGFDPADKPASALVTTAHVSAANAIKTPQFWLLWIALLCNVTAGIGILENAADMIQDFFRGDGGVSTVTATVAAGFVGLLSVANMAGRFGWSTASDYLGRKRTYMVYLGVGILLYLALSTVGSSSTALFVLFCAVIISFYGGGFSTAPAYLRDLFGTFQVGAIHGRLLTAWSTAGILGPLIVNGVLDAQGKPGELQSGDYRPALLIMTAVLVVGFVANLLIRPVAQKWHEKGAVTDAVDAAHRHEDGPVEPVPTEASTKYGPALLVTWAVVTVPLAYGLFHAAKAALQLFTG
ncbi:OFA family MFS transporter [Tsukamurella sp. PLM1]|uniref:OFA family MFS transporter n=1 Tax=Tsukamurella sp. PLM1 TaxID=2929795 RepID=UPI00205D0388|nr:OFA family MFS transporter [Tsukamurella sp. PLM1]BDH56206.1 MFS transporter [Tsukamurella sp. PLM1]